MQVGPSAISRGHLTGLASRAIALLAVVCITLTTASPAAAATLERIKESGHIKFGYIADAAPFTRRADSGAVEGYAASLCQAIAEQVKTQLALSELAVDWVPVALDSGLGQLQPGDIDILCTPISATLTRRRDVSFSIPVYPGGVRAVVRADAPPALREALAEKPSARPVWRGSPAATLLGKSNFAVVSGTTSETTLKRSLNTFQIDAKVVSLPDYRTALQQLREGKVNVVFGDRAVVLGAMDSTSRDDVVILDRLLTNEPYALALPRNDDDFRLLIDRSLTQLYETNGFRTLYTQWFGEFSANSQVFFRWTTPMP
jgi:polar amino acid transport system substrate-binding protein